MTPYYRLFIFLNCAVYVLCGTLRERSVLNKLELLEEDIHSLNSKIFRMERSRKTELSIFEQNINLRIKEMVSDVLSDVILDKVMTGEVTGVVRDGENSLIERQNRQIHQLKSLVESIMRDKHSVVTVPRKINSQPKNKKLSRKLNKIQNQIKELKDEIVYSNLKILDLEKQLENRKGNGATGKAVLTTTASKRDRTTETTTKASTTRPVTAKAANRSQEVEVHSKCREESVILACQSPDLVTWYKDGKLLTYGLRILTYNDRVSFIRDYSLDYNLQIGSLRESDGGEYTCGRGLPQTPGPPLRRHKLTVTPCR